MTVSRYLDQILKRRGGSTSDMGMAVDYLRDDGAGSGSELVFIRIPEKEGDQ